MKIEIDIPEGYEVDTENSTKECIKLKKIENKLPKTWEEFCENNKIKEGAFFIDITSRIKDIYTGKGIIVHRDAKLDRNLLPSKELAEAMLALCQLIQLRDCYNDGWKPDWTSSSVDKYVIFPNNGQITLNFYCTTNRILAFKTSELRNQFFENFRDLIEIAKPLL